VGELRVLISGALGKSSVTGNLLTARATERGVRIEWRLPEGANVVKHEIQRSAERFDGFTMLTTLFGPVDPERQEKEAYQYVDRDATVGVWYYRLVQHDQAGTIHFSDAAEVNVISNLAALGIPGQFVLEQNYPNPFNPSTVIRFGLPRSSEVSIVIYNTLGQKVAELLNEQREAGYQEARFDGSGLASGVYYYRLHAGDFLETKKMIILK
jgi:hypothetical protein